MNRIITQKVKSIPKNYITYHYKKNKSSVPPKQRPNVIKPKNIKLKPRNFVNSDFSVKSKDSNKFVKNIISKPSFTKTKTLAKGTFDSNLSKIKSIRGVGSGKILVILAPGPSILEAEINKLNKISNIDTMTINKPDSRLWPSTYWMFCDRTQYNRNKKEFHDYKNIIINTNSIKQNHPKQIKIKKLSGKGFSTNMVDGFYIGRSTTFSAMQVAAWMDYDKIFIFGLDMCRVGKKLHSYGVNPDVPEKIREKRFKNESVFYDAASKIMNDELRNKYYICSSYNPWPFVNKFNKLDQKDAVEFILNEHKKLINKNQYFLKHKFKDKIEKF